MIYGYIRTSRAAVDGLAGMHPETQLQALADAGVDPANIVSDVGISGSVPVGDRPGWTGLDARLLRGDTLTVAALDRISRNRVELMSIVESLRRRGVGIASLSPSESWLKPLGAHPTAVEEMMGEIILRVMAWAAQAELESIKRRIDAGVPAGGRGRPVPGPSQGVDPGPGRGHPAAAPERAVPVRGGADLRGLPSDRLARRAAGVAAQAPLRHAGILQEGGTLA